MSYLVDTHALIWFAQAPDLLSVKAYDAIAATDEPKFISVASLWEIGIKSSLGKLKLGMQMRDFAQAQLENAFQLLPIHLDHITHIASLPHHHGDPFDRMLIAQAEIEDLQIITKDPSFSRYGVRCVW
ncbi:MAG: type II toxin-antitoxin system VapC family toxin [Chthoniobacteraceae bacterium]